MDAIKDAAKEALEGLLPDEYFSVDPNIKHAKAPQGYLFGALFVELLVCHC